MPLSSKTPGIASRGRGFIAALVLTGLAVPLACKDSTGPRIAQVAPINNGQQGSVSAPLSFPIGVRVSAEGNLPVVGVTVTWTVTLGGGSVSPATSVTDAEGIASTQWTLGPTVGTQTATASVAGFTADFTATAGAVATCEAVINLAVGGSCLASPSVAANAQVGAGASAGEFTAIAYYDAGFTRAATTVNASATGAVGVSGPPTPVVVPSLSLAASEFSAARMPDVAFESRLRRRERAELGPLVAAARARRQDALRGRLGATYTVAPTEPRFVEVGDVLTLNTNSQNACASPINKQGVVKKISPRAVFVEDTENPAGGFTNADYDDLAAAFETVVWPSDVAAFGEPTDIDNNGGRAIIFFTIEVNKLTPAGSASFVGGFFFSRDLFPKTTTVVNGKTLPACDASNVAEMFYMLAPDPSDPPVFGNRRTTEFVKRIAPGSIAHELEHLINSSRRLYINPGARFPEQVWLDEGLAHMAEELAYYRASGFAPRQNLDSTAIRQQLDAINTYQISNLSRFRLYLVTPNSQSMFGEIGPTDDDLETRGATWSFLRWAADQRTGGDGDAWTRLVNSVDTGVTNLRGVFGNDIGMRARDWATAHYTDDAVGTGNAALTHPSWDYRSVLPLLEPMAGPPRRYQLLVNVLTDANPASFQLVDGGAAYLRFGVPANATATVQIRGPGGGNLPSGATVRFVRTK